MASDTFLGKTYDDLNTETPTNSDSIGVTAAAIRQIKGFIKSETEGAEKSELWKFIRQLILNDDDLKQNIIKNTYNVGDIILTLDDENPSKRFDATWQKIESSFLMGTGPGYARGSIGGNSSVYLSMVHLPEHRHGICGALRAYDSFWNSIGKFQIAQGNAMSFKDIPLAGKSPDDGGIGLATMTGEIAYLNADAKWMAGNATAGGFDKVDYVNVFTIGQQTAYNYSSYTQQGFSILPPYTAVHIWKKTA